MALEGAVDDEVGDRERRRSPQEHGFQRGDEVVLVVGVPGVLEDPGLVRDVEHRCDALVDSWPRWGRAPGRRAGAVDERRRDHRQADPRVRELGQLLDDPVGLTQSQVRHRVETPPTVV